MYAANVARGHKRRQYRPICSVGSGPASSDFGCALFLSVVTDLRQVGKPYIPVMLQLKFTQCVFRFLSLRWDVEWTSKKDISLTLQWTLGRMPPCSDSWSGPAGLGGALSSPFVLQVLGQKTGRKEVRLEGCFRPSLLSFQRTAV